MEKRKVLESRSFNICLVTLILVSVLSYAIETLPDLTDATKKALSITETLIVCIFICEYFYRVYCEEKPTKYIFSFFGIVDLLAIIPFFLMTSLDLRTLRLLRLLRIFTALKILRYNSALSRFGNALKKSRYELLIFSIASLIVLFIAAVGIYHFEHAAQPEVFKSLFDALWWSVASLTTVGYGDLYPVTVGGKIFTFFVLMIGLGLVAVPTGIIASSLAKED